jgi:uncharacterized protein (DUF885 family)
MRASKKDEYDSSIGAAQALDRRTFVIGASRAVAALTLAGAGCALAGPGADPKAANVARLNALLERMFNEGMRDQPQSMSSLGLDTGAGAWARSKLNDVSRAQTKRAIERCQRWQIELAQIDSAILTGIDAANFATIRYQNDLVLRGAQAFSYGSERFPAPYVLSQLTGSYQSVPDFLDTQHVVNDAKDAEAYLARLMNFARVLGDETDRARHDAAGGVEPPEFVIDKTLLQMLALRSVPVEKTSLVASLVQRTRQKHIGGDWAKRAQALVSGPIWSALDGQIALLRHWRASARSDAGVWRLPQGDDYYRFALHYQTTTGMSPDEVHKLGLESVEQISSEANALLLRQGLTQGSVGARMISLFKDARFIYPDTDQGRTELLDYLNGCVKAVNAKLPAYFGTLPKAGLEIRRIPVETQAGSPGGYYQDGTLDGSRPGAYYINLRDMAEVPRWTLPTLTYHEGIPGHHLQGALILEATGVPMIRRTLWFAAYGEGWALYAEQLADEMGLYAADPWGRLGYLHDALLRAVRLVLDTGIHHKQWARSQAIRYFVETMGDPESIAATEVDRYSVWPGQASSYMIGKNTWLRLRSTAQTTLGLKFDIRRFHDAGLLSGPMPLELLEHWIDAWVRTQV